MLLLLDTPAGFALFKVLDEGKLSVPEELGKDFSDSESARKVVQLKAFSKFVNITEALLPAIYIDEKPTKGLCKFLRAHCEGEILGVGDARLGNAIKKNLNITCLHNHAVMELMRGVRNQLTDLMPEFDVQDFSPISLGLSDSFREKLKLCSDKVDTTIIQTTALLNDLEKQLKSNIRKVRNSYCLHFPELSRTVQDDILYAKTVKLMGNRVNAVGVDFSKVLPKEIERQLKASAVHSTGFEVNDVCLTQVMERCDLVLAMLEYRGQLHDYLKIRMNAIAPNFTAVVGHIVGAQLIALCGGLLKLAKQPGSTVQLLGAEKAILRALKTKSPMPKYGLIFHAPLVCQAAGKHKAKIARSLAAKAVLAIRNDVFGESQGGAKGLEYQAMLEARLKILETRKEGHSKASKKNKPKTKSHVNDQKKAIETAALSHDNDQKKEAETTALATSTETCNLSSDLVPVRQADPQTEILAGESNDAPSLMGRQEEEEEEESVVAEDKGDGDAADDMEIEKVGLDDSDLELDDWVVV